MSPKPFDLAAYTRERIRLGLHGPPSFFCTLCRQTRPGGHFWHSTLNGIAGRHECCQECAVRLGVARPTEPNARIGLRHAT